MPPVTLTMVPVIPAAWSEAGGQSGPGRPAGQFGGSRNVGGQGVGGSIGAAIGPVVGGVLGVALLGTLVSDRAGFTGGLHLGIVLAALAFFTAAAVTVTGVTRLDQEPANTPSPSVRE